MMTRGNECTPVARANRCTSTMKTARKLSSSIRSVGRSISKKFSLSKPQQQLQVVCPVDAYPGKQIAIQTPDGQTLNVIVPRSVMPGMPFNVLYTPVVQQPQNKSPANQPKRSTPRHTIRVAVNAPATSKAGDIVTITYGRNKYNVKIPDNCPPTSTFMADLPISTGQFAERIEDLDDRALEARELFHSFDHDHNGLLDYEEFTDLLNHLKMPKSIICEEIVRVDMDHSHSIDWQEFTIYYNLLMERSSRGEIKECLVHVVENPFPGSLPDATQVVHLVVLDKVGVALVSNDFKKRVTIQFNSISMHAKKGVNEMKITLIEAKGGKSFLLSFVDKLQLDKAMRELTHNMSSAHDVKGQLVSKQEELRRLEAEIDKRKKDLAEQMAVSSATMITGQTASMHTEARVEVLMKNQQEAADQHSQAVIAETERKRSQLQQRLKRRRQESQTQSKNNSIQKSDKKQSLARRASVVRVKGPKDFI